MNIYKFFLLPTTFMFVCAIQGMDNKKLSYTSSQKKITIKYRSMIQQFKAVSLPDNQELVQLIHTAVEFHMLKQLEQICSQSNIMHPNKDGLLPIEVAVKKDYLDIVELFIVKYQFKINYQNPISGDTLLHYATKNVKFALAELLLKYGISCEILNKSKKNAEFYAELNKQTITDKDKYEDSDKILDLLKRCKDNYFFKVQQGKSFYKRTLSAPHMNEKNLAKKNF